jgi:hypothetical protein
MSGIYDQQTLLEMYRAATADAYSFLFIRLDAKTRETMFYLRFVQRLAPEDLGRVEMSRLEVGSGEIERICFIGPFPAARAQLSV